MLRASREELLKIASKKGWPYLCKEYILSEEFIREFRNKVSWYHISHYQVLSEEFIREFEDEVDWCEISIRQSLSEDFIREFKHRVLWFCISVYQHLSEDFLRAIADELDERGEWHHIFEYHKLSESFVRDFAEKVGWSWVVRYQMLSESLIKELGLMIPSDCWLYKTIEEKLQYIKEHNLDEVYEVDEANSCLYAYKTARLDGYSVMTFRYHYEEGKTYESHCDCNIDWANSFGLSAWTEKEALGYYPTGKLFKVKIDLEDLGCFVHGGDKIRSRRLTVVEEIYKDDPKRGNKGK